MTGAQLANALNEAAIIAGRQGKYQIEREDLDEALLRQSVGSQQARRLNDKERKIVAYHEGGHALARRLVGLDPPEILSIVPRGPALGFVGHSPAEDRYLSSQARTCSTRSSSCSAAAPPRRRSSTRPTPAPPTTSPASTGSASRWSPSSA